MSRVADPDSGVTVAVLCRSAPAIIARALTSVRRQTLAPAGVILVPAPACEASRADLSRLAARFDAQVCSPETRGDAPFGMRWLDGVETRWISLLRDVDEYYPTRLAVGLDEAETLGLVILGCDVQAAQTLGGTSAAQELRRGAAPSSDILAEAVAAAVEGRRRTSLSTLIAARSVFGTDLDIPFEDEADDGLTAVLQMAVNAGRRAALSPHRLVLHRGVGALAQPSIGATLLADERLGSLMAALAGRGDMERLQDVMERLCGAPLPQGLSRPNLLADAALRMPTAGHGRVALEFLRAALRLACAEGRDAIEVGGWRLDLASAVQTHLQLMERVLGAGPAAEATRRAEVYEARHGGAASWSPLGRIGALFARERPAPEVARLSYDLGSADTDGLLGAGWSEAEGWGRWTDGPLAYMEVPWSTAWSPSHVVLQTGQVFDTAANTGVAYASLNGAPEIQVRFSPQQAVTLALPLSQTGSTTLVLRPAGYKSRLQAPKEETRRLGIGLASVTLERRC